METDAERDGADAPLAFTRHVPDEARDGAPVVVLLHGRGADRNDLQPLRRLLPGGWPLVTPRAPHPGAPWGYGPGWAWYRYVADDRLDPDTLDTSLAALDDFLRALPDLLTVKPGPTFLGGFSQGGTTSLAYALGHPGRVAGVLNFSGFLPAEPIVELEHASGVPIFWGHGLEDPSIPFELGARGRRRLEEAGARLRSRDYPIGHWIEEGEMADAVRWMEEVARRSPAG